jgi:hypothetical protein
MTRYYIAPVRPLGPRKRVVRANRNQGGGGQQANQNEGGGEAKEDEEGGNDHLNQVQQLECVGEEYLDPTAKLGKPKTLLMLWKEFMEGLDNNKPAKDFTAVERGRVKSKYSRRLSFWMVMIRLIRAGLTDLQAIRTIQQAYGNDKSVTQIIVALQRAKTVGYHPNIAQLMG